MKCDHRKKGKAWSCEIDMDIWWEVFLLQMHCTLANAQACTCTCSSMYYCTAVHCFPLLFQGLAWVPVRSQACWYICSSNPFPRCLYGGLYHIDQCMYWICRLWKSHVKRRVALQNCNHCTWWDRWQHAGISGVDPGTGSCQNSILLDCVQRHSAKRTLLPIQCA